MKLYSANVHYKDRQVWAAKANVSVDLCVKCPMYKAYANGELNGHGQTGECCASRHEAEQYGLSGQALCDKVIADSAP
jgi:hypothetical protein